jgi:hypothetical protein
MAEEVLKPTEWEKTLNWVQELLGHQIPWYIKVPLGILVFLALIASVLLVISIAASKIKEIWTEKLIPYTYKPEQRQRAANRRMFARYLSREIVNRNIAERWRDEEFADLEAEVEAEGDRRSLVPIFRRSGLRRERSLTHALERSTERLILVEGDPGSGKSVALRHVAYRMSEAAARSRHLDTQLPVFVNLKEIKRELEKPIDRALIKDLVLGSLNKINDHFVDEFLDYEFDKGVKDGLFVFFFDSFDEIPEILSSTQTDDVVEKYSAAISDFLRGMNECRGVVASRSYKGPDRQGWKKFRILELSSSRQGVLARRALALRPELVSKLVGDLSLAQEDVRAMARNPMLLGLLCEHVRLGNDFPSTAYEVFSRYIEHRFERDAERVKSRHGLTTDELRVWAEKVAFGMTSDASLGLSPRRRDLKTALRREYPRQSLTRLDSALDALEYIKFGRSDGSTEIGNARQFTFSHRRFQEYFTTRVVIGDPDRVTGRQLLTDARWRETAVALLQTGTARDADAVVTEIKTLLEQALEDSTQPAYTNAPDSTKAAQSLCGIQWPRAALHVLGILQAGLGSRVDAIPDSVKVVSASLLNPAFRDGDLLDRKFALEVVGTVPQSVQLEYIRSSLAFDSQWLNDVIYLQIARVSDLPDDIVKWIRGAILRWGLTGQLARNWHGVRAHLLRLQNSGDLLKIARLARWIFRLDLIILISTLIVVTFYDLGRFPRGIEVVYFLGMALTIWTLMSLVWIFYTFNTVLRRFAMFMRYFIVGEFVVVSSLANLEKDFTNAIIILPSALYLSSWGPAAAICVENGKFIAPPMWPLAPFIYIQLGYSKLRVIWENRKDCMKYLFPLSLLIVLTVGMIYLLSTTKEIYQKWVVYASMAIIGMAGAALLIKLAIYLLRLVKDYGTLKSLKLDERGIITRVAFRNNYYGFTTGIWRLRFLRRVRSLSLLAAETANEEEIRLNLHDLQSENRVLQRRSRWGSFFKSDPLPRDSECRDELYMILEHLTRVRNATGEGT